MLTMLLAVAFGIGAGFVFGFPGFAILVVVGLAASAVAMNALGMGFGAIVWQLIGILVLSQVGFFVSALLRVTFWPHSERPDADAHEPALIRFRRAGKSRSTPRQQL
jgi:hypothetical protein